LIAGMAALNSPHFTEVLSFCSGIIGVVIGYYFAGKHGSL
jgi:hypothetical protein